MKTIFSSWIIELVVHAENYNYYSCLFMFSTASPNIVLRFCLWFSISRPFAVLVSEFVGVSAGCRVEAVAHFLPIDAPPDIVLVVDGHLQPLVEVLRSAIPAKEVGHVVATAGLDLGEEPRIGRVHRGGVRGNSRDRLCSW